MVLGSFCFVNFHLYNTAENVATELSDHVVHISFRTLKFTENVLATQICFSFRQGIHPLFPRARDALVRSSEISFHKQKREMPLALRYSSRNLVAEVSQER